MNLLMLRVLFWISVVMIVAIAVIPVVRFLLYSWDLRRKEFVYRFDEKTLRIYLSRFHNIGDTNPAVNSFTVFERVYHRLAGRHLYIVPLILMTITIVLFGGLAIETAIRSGSEGYFTFYQKWLPNEGVAGSKVELSHPPVSDLDAAALPFPNIVLDLTSFAAISGAYLFVVGVVIQGYRARTLLNADLLWCSFRMVISIPLGLSLSALTNLSLAPFVAFGLGAFPIEAINRIIRRLVDKTLNQSEAETADSLISLTGVTPDVAAALNGEGISAVQQIASMDPVALAVRTGLPFDYVLNLSAQSQAWCSLGSTVGKLAPLGLGDARALAKLSERVESTPTDDEAQAILESASKAASLDKDVLRSAIRNIAAEPYTQFLLQLAS
jgi:hypothetical protein